MPKPIPVPIRRLLQERARQGETASQLAEAFALSPRTVRNLLQRFRQLGDAAIAPSYRRPETPPAHAKPDEMRQAALALRRDHPTWGAGLIRVAMAQEHPDWACPHDRTIRRWLRLAGLGPAPPGRPTGPSMARATQAHDTWQVDASEHIRLKDGREVSWLRVVDEATGAVLMTAVFPPRVLDPGRPARDPGGAASGLRPVGAADEAAGGQRLAVGISG